LSLEVSTSNPPILLQILLRKESRTADGEPERFEALFGVKATAIAPRRPGETDAGASGGHISPDLAVPALLAQHVQSISAAPPHTYLQD
jgi:hypothetical protein